MELYSKIRQKNKSPIQQIAEKANVSEDYVRKILKGSRKGTMRKNGKGVLILKLAEQICNEMN